MKKAALPGDLMAKSSEAILGQPQSQAVLDIDSACLGHCVTAKSGAQSQSTPEDSSDSVASSGDETAKGDLSLSSTQVLNAEPDEAKRQPTHKTALDKASGGFKASLSAGHLRKLAESALSGEQISRLGWDTLPDGRLRIPYLMPDGSPELCHDGKPFVRWRASDADLAAAVRDGLKVAKYKSPKGNGCRPYHSALAIAAGRYAERLQDRFTALRITEGELKTEAANAHDPGRLTVGLGGVNSWRDRYDGGEESRPLVEFDEITLHGREVRLCFDSDLQKPQVAAALRGLAELLVEKGAHVLVEVLPNGLGGERLGLDDLIHRHGAEVFLEVAAIARSPFKRRGKDGETVQEWAFNPEPTNTRERNAYLSGMLGQEWRFNSTGKDHWQQWTGTYWADVIGDDSISCQLEQFAVVQGWQNRELSTLRSLQAAFRRSIKPAAANTAEGLLPFRNGCLLLNDMRLIPHDPEHGNTWALPYDYNAAAICPGIESLLLDRLGDLTSVALFRAFCRALLTGERLKCFLEITGPSNTGKSVLSNLLRALVGERNTAAGTLQRLEDRSQRFETVKFAGKRLAVFSECQDYSGQLQVLKALTGDDSIGAEIKGGRHFDFTYRGGVVLVGNGPIRASDPSGAVINRRRSLIVPGVIATHNQRALLVVGPEGAWSGELAAELPGLVNWALTMKPADAREALAQEVRSLARAEVKLETLLATDSLADWAEQYLIWAPECREGDSLRIGGADDDATRFAFASYLQFMVRQGRNSRPLTMKVFKFKLVGMLRETLGMALPPGSITSGDYRQREMGSVVPCLRFRQEFEYDAPGVIRCAVLAEASVTDAAWIGNGKSPVGKGWYGCNESNQIARMEETQEVQPDTSPVFPYGGVLSETVPSIPSATYKGSAVTHPLRKGSDPLPIEVQNLTTGEWEPGWRRIGKGKGSASVLCSDPSNQSRLIGKEQIRKAT